MKKNVIAATVIIASIICFCVCIYYIKHIVPVIDADNYVSVRERRESTDKKVIAEIADCINSAKKERMIFPRQTLHSSTMIISFGKTDGTEDSFWIYGNYFMYNPEYKGKQYKFDDSVIKIYKLIEKYNLD